jgi:hypothetical protein
MLDFTRRLFPISWSSWSSSCSKMSIGESVRKVVNILHVFLIHMIDRYPNDIPAGTRVPNWAYLNVSALCPIFVN